MPFGYLDTTYIDFPANIDVAYIQGLVTRSGLSFPQVLSEIDSRLGAFNGTVDPLVASLIRPTTEVQVDGSAPSAFQVERRGEYTILRPQTAEGAAHMLPLHKFEVDTGFTEEGLEEARLQRILMLIDSMLAGYRL